MADRLEEGLNALALKGVTGQAFGDLNRFLDELLRWNRHHNLTAIADREAGVEKHLLDSLTLLRYLSGNERLLDIGSGAGLPGLPLKICRPGLRLVSIDGVAKKIRFQRHIVRTLGLTEVTALACRIEELAGDPAWHEQFDVIVFRALGELARFVPLALPCLAPGGRFLVMKGPEGGAELQAAGERLAACGVLVAAQHRLTLPWSGAQRTVFELRRKP